MGKVCAGAGVLSVSLLEIRESDKVPEEAADWCFSAQGVES